MPMVALCVCVPACCGCSCLFDDCRVSYLLLQLHINESSYLQLVEVQESMSYPGLLTQVSA